MVGAGDDHAFQDAGLLALRRAAHLPYHVARTCQALRRGPEAADLNVGDAYVTGSVPVVDLGML